MSITADLPNIRVRFEPEVLEQLQRNAAKNERSVASEVRWIVKRYLASTSGGIHDVTSPTYDHERALWGCRCLCGWEAVSALEANLRLKADEHLNAMGAK